jgi:aspartate/methionine/tyrosine aminotransferase
MIRYIGGVPVPVRLLEEKAYALDVDQLVAKITPKTKLIVLNYPHNPTGGVIPEAGLRAVADAAVQHRIPVLADEIYSQILYDGRHVSIAAMPGMEPLAIVLDGFSKTYAMTGWRLGYGVMHPDLAVRMTQLQINSVSCVNASAQVAGIEALTGPQDAVDEMLAAFRARRDFIVPGLDAIEGVRCVMPDGAFYAFPNVSALPIDQDELARRLLDEAGVAVLSGTAFGAYGKGYLRLSYANSLENIATALDRMRQFIAAL